MLERTPESCPELPWGFSYDGKSLSRSRENVVWCYQANKRPVEAGAIDKAEYGTDAR